MGYLFDQKNPTWLCDIFELFSPDFIVAEVHDYIWNFVKIKN